MESELKSKKLDVLLHYENAFREDWRLLHRLRLLIAGSFIGLASGIVGWLVKMNIDKTISGEKYFLIYLLIALGITATACMGWFGSSINTLKRFIVQIEKALKLMDEDYYLPSESIIPMTKNDWGEHSFWSWGKGVVAACIISLLFVAVVVFI